MRPDKFLFAAGSLAFAFVPPRLARLLVGAVLALTVAMTTWIWQTETVRLGIVGETLRPDASQSILVALIEPGGVETVLNVPDTVLQGTKLQTNDVAIVFGASLDRANGLVQNGPIFETTRIGVLPTSMVSANDTTTSVSEGLEKFGPWGAGAIAVALVLFARMVLRLLSAAAFGAVTAATSFFLLHINADVAFLPIPAIFNPSLIFAVALAATAVGFKATIGDARRLGERLSAFVMAIGLIGPIVEAGLLPEVLAWALPPMAIVFPVLPPLLLATLLLQTGFDLSLLENGLVLAIFVILRLPFWGRFDWRRKAVSKLTSQLTTDAKGAIHIEQLLGIKSKG